MSSKRFRTNKLPLTALSDAQAQTIRDVVPEAMTRLMEALEHGDDDIEGGGVYVGSSGIALTLHVMHSVLSTAATTGAEASPPSITAFGRWTKEMALQSASDIAEAAARSGSPRRNRVTFLEGVGGPLALQAVLRHEQGRHDDALQAAQALLRVGRDAVSKLPLGEAEVLYGRCGYLYALMFVARHLPPGSPALSGFGALTQQLVKDVLSGGQAIAKAQDLFDWGLMWQWHGSMYLGAAHGVAGILHVLLQAQDAVLAYDSDGSGMRLVQTAAQALMQTCFPSGNLPSSLGSATDKLVQWCHGAPGLVHLMLQCHRVWGSGADGGRAAYLQTARKAAEVIWERGLLTKGVGLCHGVSGNAYAFLAMYRETREERYLHMAQQFALYAAQNWQKQYDVPDRPASLYEGLAGAVCLWLHVMRPEVARFPGFEL